LGGGGCFGLNLARMLLEHGHEVIGAGRSPLKGEAFTLGAERKGYLYKVFQVGADNEFLLDWLDAERPSVIVNFAAQGEGAASYKARNWKYFYRTNVVALAELTEMLLGRQYLERFIQVGSSEVYGSVTSPATEEASPKPTSVYANSKLAFDLHLQSLARHWQFPAIVVRPSNCMTPGQQLHRVVPKTFLLALTGRRLELHGGGRASKSYMAADDLSEAILLLSQHGQVGEIYNAGPEVPVSIRRLVEICAQAMSRRIEEVAAVAPDRDGQDECYWIDSSKLKRLGWLPRVSLEKAVEQVRGWVQDHLPVLGRMPTEFEMRA
jgi:dTDP-glucose 4,6-dehydratase